MRRPAVFVLPLLLLSLAARAEDAPTIEQARDLYKSGQYKDALSLVSRLQERHRGEAVDRFELFMLKGEIQLRLRDGASALSAFALAGKEADRQKPEQRDRALAMETLLRHSSGLVYHPRPDPSKALDITDEQGRKDAFAAIFADQYEPLAKAYERIKTTTSLDAIVGFVKPLPMVRALEIAATTSDQKTAEMLPVLRERALAVLDVALDSSERQLATIQATADKLIEAQVDVPVAGRTGQTTKKKITRKQGPLPTQVGTLKQIAVAAEKFGPTLRDLADDIKLPPEATQPRLTRNGAVLKLANTMLTTDYTQPVAVPATRRGRGG